MKRYISQNYKQFIEDNKFEIIDNLNDSIDDWKNDVIISCIDEMLQRLDEAGVEYPNNVDQYLEKIFDKVEIKIELN